MVRALAMLSGGMDSTLAVKIIVEQGIDVIAVKFSSPFCTCDSGGVCHAMRVAHHLGIKLIHKYVGEDYLDIIR